MPPGMRSMMITSWFAGSEEHAIAAVICVIDGMVPLRSSLSARNGQRSLSSTSKTFARHSLSKEFAGISLDRAELGIGSCSIR